MRLIGILFRHVIYPIIILFAVIIGFMSAVLSGLIEYQVLAHWFFIPNSDTPAFFFPLALVTVLEGAKLVLHFCNTALWPKPDKLAQATCEKKTRFVVLKWGLVLLSWVCSLIFTSYTLFGSTPDIIADETTEKVSILEHECNTKLQSYIDECEAAFEQAIATVDQNVRIAEAELNAIEPIFTPQVAYERYLEVLHAAEEKLKTAQEVREQRYKTEQDRFDRLVREKEAEIEQYRKEQLDLITAESLSSSAGDNRLLRAFLLLFSKTIRGSEYSRVIYLVWVIGLSSALSLFLELIICLAQYLLTISPEKLNAIVGEAEIDSATKTNITHVLKVMIAVMVSCGTFVLLGALQEITYSKVEFISAVACFLIVGILPSAWLTIGVGEKKSEKVLSEVKAIVVKGIVSFAGYIVLGLVFGATFPELTPSAIGITVGSTMGHIIHI